MPVSKITQPNEERAEDPRLWRISDCILHIDQAIAKWSGSQGSLLNPSPIRTVLVSFPTYGSSLS